MRPAYAARQRPSLKPIRPVPPPMQALALDWGDVLHGTVGAPWLWWAVALLVILLLLLGAMKLLGLFPE